MTRNAANIHLAETSSTGISKTKHRLHVNKRTRTTIFKSMLLVGKQSTTARPLRINSERNLLVSV